MKVGVGVVVVLVVFRAIVVQEVVPQLLLFESCGRCRGRMCLNLKPLGARRVVGGGGGDRDDVGHRTYGSVAVLAHAVDHPVPAPGDGGGIVGVLLRGGKRGDICRKENYILRFPFAAVE